MAKQKDSDKTEPATTVSRSETSLARATPATQSVKKAKLAPKNRTGLPRRQKKAQQKAAARVADGGVNPG